MVERLTQLCELQKTKQNSHGNGSQREKEHETFMHLNKLFDSLLTVCSAASKFSNHMRQPKSDMTDKVYQHNMHRLLGGMKLSDFVQMSPSTLRGGNITDGDPGIPVTFSLSLSLSAEAIVYT
jgi:hypothetical protein